jgi:hypothetical protein
MGVDSGYSAGEAAMSGPSRRVFRASLIERDSLSPWEALDEGKNSFLTVGSLRNVLLDPRCDSSAAEALARFGRLFSKDAGRFAELGTRVSQMSGRKNIDEVTLAHHPMGQKIIGLCNLFGASWLPALVDKFRSDHRFQQGPCCKPGGSRTNRYN